MLLDSSFLHPRFRAGGPRPVSLPMTDVGFDRDLGTGRGRINFKPIAPLPKPIPTPTENAQRLGGGLTLAQLDRAARFEIDQGAPVGVFFGRNLFAPKLVSQEYDAVTPRNTFTGIFGQGWELDQRGEWNRIVAAYYLGEPLTNRFSYTVWFDDRPPQGAALVNDTDGWNWVAVSPRPLSGKYAHQSPPLAGVHQHFFQFASQGLTINSGDIISCWIWIDPVNTPTEVMLQFAIGSDFEHRAYWGANSINFGTNGTSSRRQISASVPAIGQWVRLDVPANDVGLGGTTINGMAFTLFGGAATWDQVVRWKDDRGGGNTGYTFFPGVNATHIDDIVQGNNFNGADAWLRGLFYNASAGATFRLSGAQSAQNRPDGAKVIAECRKLPNYDASGAEIVADYGYSASPARVITDRGLYFFERRFRNRLDVARDLFRRRYNWPSWVDFRESCAKQLPWDREGDGVNVFVPRAEFHGGWTGPVTMAQVLDDVCGQSFAGWQDDGEQIIFIPLSESREPVHHFHPGNIVRAPERSTQKLRSRPNRVILRYRDTESEFHEEAAVEPPDDTAEAGLRQDSIAKVGEIRSDRAVGGMTASQAQRLAEFTARFLHDNAVRINLVGNATAIHLLKWDLVTVSHAVLGWDHQLCLVLSSRVRSARNSADEVEVDLLKIDGALNDDGAHRARQEALEL